LDWDTPITTEEYRELLNDHESSDEQIQKRLDYLESFCRNIARLELQNLKNRVIQNNNGKS
jgi:hypothetical protein